MERLDVMIEKAIKVNACSEEIDKIKKFKNLDDLIENTDEWKKHSGLTGMQNI